MHKVSAQIGFADALMVGGGSRRLEQIAQLLDWAGLDELLAFIHAAGTGRPAYAPLVMIKVLLLQSWYGLGDPGMEEALGDRLSFRRFVGLSLQEAVPDHSTISRFRAQLVRLGLMQALFEAVNRQLQARQMLVKSGTLIDATLVRSAASEPPRQKGGGRSEADPDAAWVKKGDAAHFGYKLHVGVDRGSLLVRSARLTPANVNEIVVAPDLVMGDEASVWADKAYVGPSLRAAMQAHAIKDRVQQRNSRGHTLTRWQVRRNVLIGRVRGRIEGVFGTLKRSYGLSRMRFMGLARNSVAVFITLIAWNLNRAIHLV